MKPAMLENSGGIKLPRLALIRQTVPCNEIDNIKKSIFCSLEKSTVNINKLAGKTIGITVGSRGINEIPEIIRSLVEIVKTAGGKPVLIPAMGSHGGGKIDGQKSILKSLGITETTTGAQIMFCVDTIQIGKTHTGIPVYCNSEATKVDGLIVVNRIKQHTDFSGQIESGICKMLTIGLGSSRGALTAHSFALLNGYETTIIDIANIMIQKLPIFCAVGILENWKGKTSEIEILEPDKIMTKEPQLLQRIKEAAIKLPFEKINVLVIKEIGKNISGTGMDTKVVGRIMIKGQKEPETPKIDRIVVLNLSPESHGNAIGMGLADLTTRRAFNGINLQETSFNSISSMCLEQGKIPCVVDNDQEAIKAGLTTLGAIDPEKARLVYIKNTQEIETIYISESLLDEVLKNNYLEIIKEPEELIFDDSGNLLI